jgi:PleD family two-component response regulator
MLSDSLRDLKVLVIDDNRHMRLIVKALLLQIGASQFREASDAAFAFKEMQNFPADLIIVDWQMEPLDGLDFVRLVRTAKDSRNPYVPIIMLSGHTEYRRVAEARDAGVNEFLAKPVSAEILSNRITSIFKHPRDFVRVKTYTGPCRRRNDLGLPQGMRDRRKADRQQLGAA